jgi:hypothetical protein
MIAVGGREIRRDAVNVELIGRTTLAATAAGKRPKRIRLVVTRKELRDQWLWTFGLF